MLNRSMTSEIPPPSEYNCYFQISLAKKLYSSCAGNGCEFGRKRLTGDLASHLLRTRCPDRMEIVQYTMILYNCWGFLCTDQLFERYNLNSIKS